jgi:hypothetical protein
MAPAKRSKARPQADPAVSAEEWNPVASFIVEYQRQGEQLYRTRVHQMETGESKTFSGVVFEPIAAWIQAHSGLEQRPDPSSAEAPTEPVVEVFSFSPHLRRLLDKGGLPAAPPLLVPASQAAPAEPIPAAPPPVGDFSPRLQELVARAGRG